MDKQRPMTFQEFQRSSRYVSLFEAKKDKGLQLKLQRTFGKETLVDLTYAGLCGVFFYAKSTCHIKSFSDSCDMFQLSLPGAPVRKGRSIPDEHNSDNLARLELLLYRNYYLLELAV